MREDPQQQTPRPEQPPEGQQAWPGAPSATAAPPPYPPAYPPIYPPAPGYYQPGAYPPPPYGQPPVYPPPPEYYQQGGAGSAPSPPPPPAAYPPLFPPDYGAYPPQANPYAPYPPYPPYPPRANPYGPPSALPEAQQASEVDGRLRLFWPIVSAVVSFAVYALLLGWQFGLGFMGMLLIHEMGHFVVIRAKGLPAGLPIFIPLLGAFVTMRRAPQGVRDEAEIAIAGPLVGTVGGLVCLIAYWQTGIPVLLPLAYYSFFINLLNLIPVGPLDGARVTAAISKWIWPLGLLGVGLAAWYTRDILLIVLAVFGVFQLFARFGEAGKSHYYAISAGARVYITLLYFGLAAVLAYGTYALQPLMNARGGLFY